MEISLYPKRIDIKLVGPSGVTICVENDTNKIIAKHVVTVGKIRPQSSRIIMANECKIQVALVVGNQSFCLDGWLYIVDWKKLGEIGYSGRRLPAGIIEVAID